MTQTQRKLNEFATHLLRSRGFTAGGRFKGSVSPQQCRFEQGIIHNSCRGRSAQHNKGRAKARCS